MWRSETGSKSGGSPAGCPPPPSCPSWARTRTLLIPCHFGFRRRSTSVRGLDCAFTFALTRSGGSHPVSTPSSFEAWLGVASEGSADFESFHARRFRRGVQRAHRWVPLESGVLPVTPRGSATRTSNAPVNYTGTSFYLGHSLAATGTVLMSIVALCSASKNKLLVDVFRDLSDEPRPRAGVPNRPS